MTQAPDVDAVGDDDLALEQTRFERAKEVLESKGYEVRRCDPSGFFAHSRTRARFAAEITDLERFASSVVAKKQHSRRRV